MVAGEFQLIARHLSRLGEPRTDVHLGPGDDGALIAAHGAPLAVAHASVSADGDPDTAATTCVARAVASLRAAGATPAWATLALSLARVDEEWIEAFAAALDRACRDEGVCVVGGDTTSGAPAVTLFVTGTR